MTTTTTTTVFVQQPVYAASQAIDITLDGLASGAWRQSEAIDNLVDRFQDVLLHVRCAVGAGALLIAPRVEVWAYQIGHSGAYTDGASGTDGPFSMPANPNLVYVGALLAATQSSVMSGTFSLLAAAQMRNAASLAIPPVWGIVVGNLTGIAFGATSAASYVGLNTRAEEDV